LGTLLRKKLPTTKPKRNADFRAKPQRSVYIYEVAKSYGFSFGTKKEKAKQ